MELTPETLRIDLDETVEKLKRFIKGYVEESHAKGVVLGLSGGIDSCAVSALSAVALGGNRVLGLLLPEKEVQQPKDIEHAKLVAEKFCFKTEKIDITQTLDATYSAIPVFDPSKKVYKGNLKARIRMLFIYYYANRLDRLVCGSSDKSETMMGYFTKWGDGAADIAPIMDLYKTQVKQIALHIGVPKAIVTKPSSPSLWPKQTAEEELGMKYELLDLILYGLEHFVETSAIAEQLSIDRKSVERVKQRWLSMEHKRRMGLSPKLGYRTVGMDFRLARNTL